MPNKVIKPIDSLLAISGYILNVLNDQYKMIDDIFCDLNEKYPKKISVEKIILSLDFLYSIDKIFVQNDEVKLK